MGARGPKPMPRLSFAPLDAALARHHIDPEFIEGPLNAVTWQGRFQGWLTLAKADEIACHVLKMHPAEIWGAEYAEKVWHDGDDLQDVDLEVGMADVKVARRRVA